MTNADKIDGIIRGLETYKTHGPDAFPLGTLAMLGKLMSDLGEACTAAAKRKAMEQLEASEPAVRHDRQRRAVRVPPGRRAGRRRALTFLETEPQPSEHAVTIGRAQWTGPGGVRHWAIGDRAVTRDPGTMLMYTACGKHDIPANKAVYSDETTAITCPECFVLSLAQR